MRILWFGKQVESFILKIMKIKHKEKYLGIKNNFQRIIIGITKKIGSSIKKVPMLEKSIKQ